MISKINNSLTFKGITFQDGGLDYVRQQEGEIAVSKAQTAQKQFENSKWKLDISQSGYTLKSPTRSKTYTGPFTVKKLLKTGASRIKTSAISIRMDENNRTKYIIHLPDMKEVSRIYKTIKNSHGLEKMLTILSLLEKHI